MEKEMTLKQAYSWVVKKWKYIVKNDGLDDGLLDKYPALDAMSADCAYCELFALNCEDEYNCDGCPLNIHNGAYGTFEFACSDIDHPYHIWAECPNKETAQDVLNLILKTKPDEPKNSEPAPAGNE